MALSTRKAKQFRDYVSAIPDGDRQQFLSTYNNLSDAGKAEVIGKTVGFEDTTPLAAKALPYAVGGAALAGAKVMADPWIDRTVMNQTQVNPLRQKYNVNPNINTQGLPSAIQRELSALSDNNGALANQFKGQLTNHANLVKNTVIKPIVDNLSTNYPAWRKSGWDAYGNGLKDIEDTLSKSGTNIEPYDFNKNVIAKTAQTMQSRGLSDVANSLADYGAKLTDEPMSFSEAKQAITNLSNNNPAAARELKANWGEHLQSTTGGTEIGDKLTALNQAYTPFKQADNVASSLIDSNKGTLDTKKLTNALSDYYMGNNKANPQTSAFLKVLGGDTTLATGIPDISSQADTLDGAVKNRGNILQNQQLTQNDNISKVNEIKADLRTATDLAAIDKGLGSRMATRGVAAGIAAAAMGAPAMLGAVGKIMLPSVGAGILENKVINNNLGFDPVQGIQAVGTGIFGNDQQKQDMMNRMQQAYQQSLQT